MGVCNFFEILNFYLSFLRCTITTIIQWFGTRFPPRLLIANLYGTLPYKSWFQTPKLFSSKIFLPYLSLLKGLYYLLLLEFDLSPTSAGLDSASEGRGIDRHPCKLSCR